MNLDKDPKVLSPDECFYALNHKSPALLNDRSINSKGGVSSQYPANYPACEFASMPVGESYSIGTYYSQLTKELYSAFFNSNGVNYIQRSSNERGCEVVYTDVNESGQVKGCMPLSADPKNALTQFRGHVIRESQCANRGGEYFMFVDGLNEYFIDTQAAIATNNFNTPFFQRCGNPCDFVRLAVPSPQFPPKVSLVPITLQERNLTNFIVNQGYQFRFYWGYYDLIRSSIPSPISKLEYAEDVTGLTNPNDVSRLMKLRIPVGSPMVDFIVIMASVDNGNTWYEVKVIEKYKKYNSIQQMWYERDLAELSGYSDVDCSFDFIFDGKLGAVIDTQIINRNIPKLPRQARYIMPIDERAAYGNYIKGSCPVDKIQTDKFRVFVNNTDINIVKGLKQGGTYDFGFVIHYDDGTFEFVYGVQTLNIAREQDKNAQDFRGFGYDFRGMILPLKAKSVSIVRTKNKNPFVLRWKVDNVDRSNGNVVLTIQSLNDYNTSKFFKTNTVYQYVPGDRIEFIRKADNQIFTVAQYGLLNYPIQNPNFDTTVSNPDNPPADFFNQIVVKDDGRLTDVRPGAVIEIQRPLKAEDNPLFYEIGVHLKVVNGQVVNPLGSFNTFDSYFFKRSISPTITFEHFAPADLWPVSFDGPLSDIGRAWVVNKFENEKRVGRNILLNYPNEFNMFEVEKQFRNIIHGDITAAWLVDDQIGIAISENDNGLFSAAKDLLRVDNNGNVRASSADEIISEQEPKLSGKYGCRYEDIQSIYFGDGWVFWIDGNRHTAVIHDYNSAKNAAKGKAESYFKRRIQEIAEFNSRQDDPLKKVKWITGYNHTDECIMITTKALRDSGINNQPEPYLQQNATIIYHPGLEDYLTFVSFTPDAYGVLPLFDGQGCSFVSYFRNKPYIHPILSQKCNEFYGVPCDTYLGLSFNSQEGKVIRAMAIEMQGDMMWYVKKVTTENLNFVSEIPAARFKKYHGDKWNAGFLFNKNSSGGLYGNGIGVPQETRGYYVKVIFCRDNTLNLGYNTIDNNKRTKYSYTDTFFFKFAPVEQSAFTANV